MPQTASAAPIRRALPPGKQAANVQRGRDTTALSQPTRALANAPHAPWWDMPDGPERLRASMLWNCDELHKQGRTDLAKSLSAAFKLNWAPVMGARQAPKTAALSLDDVEDAPTSAPDIHAAHYDAQAHRDDPFAKGS